MLYIIVVGSVILVVGSVSGTLCYVLGIDHDALDKEEFSDTETEEEDEDLRFQVFDKKKMRTKRKVAQNQAN